MGQSIICITGGIASGKTMAADYLAKKGFALIDADVVSRKIVEPGSECLKSIVQEFGSVVLNSDGSLNRSALKRMVFDDSKKLGLLNQLTHPAIEQEIKRQLIQTMKSHVLLVIPLLDSRMIASYKINRVVVVDVSYDTQLRRVLSRDGVDVSLANSMIYTQATRKERLDLATDVLVNNGLIEDLYFSCDKLSEILLLR